MLVPPPTWRTTRPGFTMLEIVIAVGLMAFALIPVMVFNQRNLVEAGFAREQIVARQALINMVERFKDESPRALLEISRNPELIASDPLLTRIDDSPGVDFERMVSFESDVGENPGIHRVTFAVSWSPRGKDVRREVKLARLVHWHRRTGNQRDWFQPTVLPLLGDPPPEEAGSGAAPAAGSAASPAAGSDRSPAAGSDRAPAAGSDRAPAAGSDRAPAAGSDTSPARGGS